MKRKKDKRVSAVNSLDIHAKCLVVLMNDIVASVMVLFSTTFRSLLPNRSKLHGAFESNSLMSKPLMVSWRKRSLRIKSN